MNIETVLTPARRRALLREVRARGSVCHAELDLLLADASGSRAFANRVSRLIEALQDVVIEPGLEGCQEQRGGSSSGGFDYLLRGTGRSDPLATYVREIARIPRMDREDEVRIARRLEFVRRRFERAMHEAGIASADAEVLLKRCCFHGPQSGVATHGRPHCHLPGHGTSGLVHRSCSEYNAVRQEFIERSLHLVVAASVPYRTYGVPLLDLIQEGNAGLIRAVEKFDWRKEVRFRTYAAFWIRQAVERAISAAKGIVRVPNYVQQKMRRLRREGRIPRRNEETLVRDVSEAFKVPHQVAGRLLETERSTRSLDVGCGDDGEDPLAASLASDARPEVLFDWELPVLKERIAEALRDLSESERKIVEYRFGLGSADPMTLEEVGRVMKVSRERVRQLQVRAMRKLQAPKVMRSLAHFA
ncbi:MAG: sigma-70 family RNA polymerase sigma factor [Planctomycetes bacterium]|nr:sigma-70 family RNA polymerase sigma factor [Planctomycetota bacterium]